MKLNTKKFLELANQNKFEAADIIYSSSKSTSFSIYNGEIENYSSNESIRVSARGIINGKFGAAATEKIDKNTPDFLIKSIQDTASIIESDDPCLMFKGSKKYKKSPKLNESIYKYSDKDKINLLLEIEKKLKAYDPRVAEVASVSYSESIYSSRLENTYGLKLKKSSLTISVVAEISAKLNEETQTGFSYYISDSLDDFKIDEFVKKVAEDALRKLGSQPIKSKKYPVVFDQETFSTMLDCYLTSCDAEEVQKHTSLFEGKLNQQVASKKLTVVENPHVKGLFFNPYDSEGVATQKKTVIKKGVLQTYIYTLETAYKAKVEPTGNGRRAGAKSVAGFDYLEVKPGKKTEEEMLSTIKEGLYITDLQGLHSGMNTKSGNFSLQCCGFLIKDGKKDKPVSLITVAGNLVDMFNDIACISSNLKVCLNSGMNCPSVKIKKLSISGK